MYDVLSTTFIISAIIRLFFTFNVINGTRYGEDKCSGFFSSGHNKVCGQYETITSFVT